MERIAELTNKIGALGTLGVGFALAGLLGFLGYLYVISPFGDEIQKKKATVEASEKNVAKLKVLAENREIVIDRGAKIYANYLKGSRLLPSGEQISQVIEAIEGKANQVGTEVISFDAFKLGSKSAATPEVSERVVEGELRGSHEALVSFLRAISYYERITEVRAVSAVKDERGGERLKFVLAAYYMPSGLKVPEEMKQRALKILEKEGFDLEKSLTPTEIATVTKPTNPTEQKAGRNN